MDITIISTIMIPILGFLKVIQLLILKKCDSYVKSDALDYKTIKRTSLVPAYIKTIQTYFGIRYGIRRKIEKKDYLWIDNQIKSNLKDNPKYEINPIEIHQYVENIIDGEYEGRPEQIFRSKDDWENRFKESYQSFYNGLFHLYQIKALKHRRNWADTLFWILMALAVATFLITIMLEVSQFEYSIFSIDAVIFSFFIGFGISISLIIILVITIIIKKDLDKVYEDATKYEI